MKVELNDLQLNDFELLLRDYDNALQSNEQKLEIDIETHSINEKTITAKIGDVFDCGEHRVVVGSACNVETIATALKHQAADLLLTDPPYGVGAEKAALVRIRNIKHSSLRVEEGVRVGIINDTLKREEYTEFINSSFSSIIRNLKPGGVFYVWHGDAGFSHLVMQTALENLNCHISGNLVWLKDQFILSFADYKWQHEPCFYGWLKGASHNFYGARNSSTILERDAIKHLNLRGLDKAKLIKIIVKLIELGTKNISSIIRCDKPPRSPMHPSQKPVTLFKQLILNSTLENALVLDPFGGSGTTLIACEELKRRCALVELDPLYAQESIMRWESMTGQKAVKVEPQSATTYGYEFSNEGI
jgi:DNA modification methylase